VCQILQKSVNARKNDNEIKKVSVIWNTVYLFTFLHEYLQLYFLRNQMQLNVNTAQNQWTDYMQGQSVKWQKKSRPMVLHEEERSMLPERAV